MHWRTFTLYTGSSAVVQRRDPLTLFFGAGAVRAACRVLTVVGAEDPVELGGVLLEGKGTVEELLCCHGKELGLIRTAIGVKEGLVALPGYAAQPQEFVGTYGHPFGELVAVGYQRGAVGSTVEHVELMGEFMVDHIMTLIWVARPVEDGVPDEDNRPLGEGLAKDGNGGIDRTAYVLEHPRMVFRRHDSGGVDEDRLHVSIVVMGESQLKQTGLRRNRDAYLVGEVEAATTLPVLLLQEDLHCRMEFSPLSVVEQAVVGQVRTHEGLPFGGKRALSHLGAATVAKPVEHGMPSFWLV